MSNNKFQYSPGYLLGVISFVSGIVMIVYGINYPANDIGVIIRGIIIYSGVACLGLSLILTAIVYFVVKKLNNR